MKVFLVYESDGYSRGPLLAGFSTKAAADKLVNRCGGYATVEEVQTEVYGSYEEYAVNSPQAKKEKALAKLTPEERKLLGH